MNVTVSFTYWERDVIPPRCRKPRDVEHRATTEVTVREVTADEAPVAFHVTAYSSISRDADYRWWDERLWLPYLPWSGQTEPTVPGSDQFPADGLRWDDWRFARYDGLAEAEAAVRDHYAGFLIIDGHVWNEAGEPRYVVMTFGLGHNHGGTALMDTDGYNSNIRRDRYFRADQHDQAQAEALRIAAGRGDTDDLPRIAGREPQIRVLVPEAVRCQPPVEAGDGDPFINQVEGIIEAVDDPVVAGLLGMSLALKDVR